MPEYVFRSILFVPGDSPKKLRKAIDLPADAIIIDWEDAVAPDRKAEARVATRAAMPALLERGIVVFVRPNPIGTEWARADQEAIKECRPAGVVIAKCEAATDVEHALDGLPERVCAIALIESPLGVLRVAEVVECSERVAGLMFGAEDYSARAGVRRSGGEPELAFARSSVVNAARALRREVFDSPTMEYGDLQAVREASQRARRFGFTGKAAIHPGQVPVINAAFMPTEDELEHARGVIDRHREHGGGVYGSEGSMEDMPIVLNAMRLIEYASRFKS